MKALVNLSFNRQKRIDEAHKKKHVHLHYFSVGLVADSLTRTALTILVRPNLAI